MNNLYHWMKLAKQNDPEASMRILLQFEPKLKQSLRRTSYQERDDLKQELQLKLLEAMTHFNMEDVPGFFDYIAQLENELLTT